MSYNTKVYQEQGGAKTIVESGGSIEIKSGGVLDVKTGGIVKANGTQAAAIVSLTDSTTGTAGNTVDDTTASVKDDIASLAAKINGILAALRGAGIIVT